MPRQHTPGFVATDGEWRSPPLRLLTGFRLRLRGIRAVPPGWGALLRTRSVHTIGRRAPVAGIGVDDRGLVRWRRVLPPRRVIPSGSASWVIEVPAGTPLPPEGRLLRVVPILAACPGP